MKSSKSYVIYVSIVAALGGLLFGFDTVVISGAIDALVKSPSFLHTAGG